MRRAASPTRCAYFSVEMMERSAQTAAPHLLLAAGTALLLGELSDSRFADSDGGAGV